MKYLRSFAAACLAGIAATASAEPPVPFYATNVTKINKQSPGTIVIVTKDSPEAVCAWYRKNLAESTSENKVSGGAVIFYTKSGATVDVEPGSRFDPVTRIGLSWDAKKFGAYAGK
jgi:hypothetical protein